MRIGNTFTYYQSSLPPFRPEIKAEIAAIDCKIADLILRCCGNPLELEALAESLDNCADSCDLNLKSIQIISDTEFEQNQEASLLDLCPEQKQLVIAQITALSIALEAFAQLTGLPREQVNAIVYKEIVENTRVPTQGEVDTILRNFLQNHKEFHKDVSSIRTNFMATLTDREFPQNN